MPKKSYDKTTNIETKTEFDATKKASCPCCGYITIPNDGDALAYICPICFWEIDTFISSEDEESDFEKFGAVLPHLKKHCRQPLHLEKER